MSKEIVPQEALESKILMLRGHKVLLDSDLASLYGVPTFRFNEAIKRNLRRFPADFMFRLTPAEAADLKSHNAISSSHGGRRTLPYAFTEHGSVMAANILRSEKALQMSVYVVRAFVKLRGMLAAHEDLARKLAELEKKYDEQFRSVFDAIRALMEPPGEEPRKITGFRP